MKNETMLQPMVAPVIWLMGSGAGVGLIAYPLLEPAWVMVK